MTATGSDVLPEFGPGAMIEGEESPFLLSRTEWYTLQRYVNEALTLPTNEPALRRELGMAEGESFETLRQKLTTFSGSVAIFEELITAYGSINHNCRTWRDTTFPLSVNLADSITHYALKVPTYYGALRDVLRELRRKTGPEAEELRADARDIIDELSADAQSYADQAADIRDAIVAFAQATKQDKLTITSVHDRMTAQAGDFGVRINEINQNIAKLQQEIDQLNKDYEKSVVVAATTPTYAWVFPFGLIAAAVVAGIYGDAAVKLMKKIDTAKAEWQTLDEELKIKNRLHMLSQLADSRIDGVIELIGPALEVVQKIEGVWRALVQDFANLNDLIDSIETGLEERVRTLHLRVSTAMDQWEMLGVQANAYRVNAFIDAPPA